MGTIAIIAAIVIAAVAAGAAVIGIEIKKMD